MNGNAWYIEDEGRLLRKINSKSGMDLGKAMGRHTDIIYYTQCGITI